jgi:selenide,water dikinase
LEATRHPNLIAGIGGSEDAGVFRISDDVAIVQSVDFFTPIVDEATDWGRIVAANALSDLYAMGAQPLTALQVVGWPRGVLSYELLGDVLDGAAEVLSEARCTLVGGHTVDDPEPKFGMSVTGLVHPDDVVTNSAGEPGDVLVLTKPLGTGIIATAIKRGKAAVADRDAAVRSMVTLNAGAAAAMRRVGVRAATDITGFGLLGHLGEMLRAGSVSARIDAAAVPLLSGAREGATAGLVPGGTERNLAAAAAFTTFVDVDADLQTVLADAQTSGGLLLAIEPPLEKALHQALEDEGVHGASIGVLTERAFSDGPTGRITVR